MRLNQTIALAALALPTLLLNTALFAQYSSPAETESKTINGKALTIKYAAPSVHGRQIFGPGGILSKDPNYPVWRAGANSATTFTTAADLTIGSLNVPKGQYTLYVLVQNPDAWELIVNKQTGQWGLEYDPKMDLGRVKMTMSKPPSPVEQLKYTITDNGGGMALCGACTVHINGSSARACITPISAVAGKTVTTIEGLSHPVQDAWIEEDVPQCGYCQSGQLMAAASLLSKTSNPTDADIDEALKGNICRCGTYNQIRRAIHRAAAIKGGRA